MLWDKLGDKNEWPGGPRTTWLSSRRAWCEAATRDRHELAAAARLLAAAEDDELVRLLAATEGDPGAARPRAAAAVLLEARWSAATAGRA